MKALLLMLLVACTPAHASVLKAVDTYGSQQVTLSQILATARTEIVRFDEAMASGDFEAAATAQTAAIAKISQLAPFAFVQLSRIQYPPPSSARYLTVDLVDQADQMHRMNFLPAPQQTFADPGGLLAEWDSYFALAMKLLMAGEIQLPIHCHAFHCVAGFDHPMLKRYGELFNREVPIHQAVLFDILHSDGNAHHRADAAFLLAHTHDGPKLVTSLAPSIRDGSEGVRNNVMRVLAYIGNDHPELSLPIEALVQAADFPTATDRNKSLYCLVSVSKHPELRADLVHSIGRQLLAILKLQQPNNHDPAYDILKNLSGKDFGDRSYTAWEKWLDGQISSSGH